MKNKVLFVVTILVVFLLGLLASSIVNRKSEAKYQYVPQVNISENEPRNDVWGENFPLEYQSSLQTLDTTFSSFQGGSAMRDVLEEDPNLVILFAGYGFSKDYNQGRGHAYAIDDLHNSLRTGGPTSKEDGPMPATCWTCKSPDVPRLMNEIGIEEFYSGKWAGKVSEVVNPIGCADCHDPKSMKLRISRPALVEAFDAMGKDINKATHNEMRSLVCAQCHVEYYFDKKGHDGVPYLTFPWDNGFSAEDIEKCSQWLNEACVHWGLNQAHKQDVLNNSSMSGQFTWQFGFTKLLQGFAYSDHECLYQDQVLLANVEGNDALILGNLMLFIEQLQLFTVSLYIFSAIFWLHK